MKSGALTLPEPLPPDEGEGAGHRDCTAAAASVPVARARAVRDIPGLSEREVYALPRQGVDSAQADTNPSGRDDGKHAIPGGEFKSRETALPEGNICTANSLGV